MIALTFQQQILAVSTFASATKLKWALLPIAWLAPMSQTESNKITASSLSLWGGKGGTAIFRTRTLSTMLYNTQTPGHPSLLVCFVYTVTSSMATTTTTAMDRSLGYSFFFSLSSPFALPLLGRRHAHGVASHHRRTEGSDAWRVAH